MTSIISIVRKNKIIENRIQPSSFAYYLQIHAWYILVYHNIWFASRFLGVESNKDIDTEIGYTFI